MDSPISYEELNSALAKLKLKKSPGPDCITNEMIISLGKPALYKLLEIYNKSWEEGSLLQSWREATMIPIHKPGKAKTETTSYRPISMTSCMVKLLERIINTRLKWFLETEKTTCTRTSWIQRILMHRRSNHISGTENRSWIST